MKEFWSMVQLVFTGIGGWLGMRVFHHKTRKAKFVLVSFSAIVWIFIVIACILNIF